MDTDFNTETSNTVWQKNSHLSYNCQDSQIFCVIFFCLTVKDTTLRLHTRITLQATPLSRPVSLMHAARGSPAVPPGVGGRGGGGKVGGKEGDRGGGGGGGSVEPSGRLLKVL